MKTIFGAIALVTLLSFARPTAAFADPQSSDEIPPWKQAIELIERAKESGELTIDEAAALRLLALTRPDQLPAEFRPDSEEISSSTAEEAVLRRDGLAELAAMLDALFIDREAWSLETEQAILSQIACEEVSPIIANLPDTQITEHFIIHWNSSGPDAPVQGSLYISEVASALEHAWSVLQGSGYSYEMPDPAQFGRIPDPTDGKSRFDVLIGSDIRVFNLFSLNARGVSLPGEIRLLNRIPFDEVRTSVTHELFHMLQWNYANYRDSDCKGWLEALAWYSGFGAWLMESTATWAEDVHFRAPIGFPDQCGVRERFKHS